MMNVFQSAIASLEARARVLDAEEQSDDRNDGQPRTVRGRVEFPGRDVSRTTRPPAHRETSHW